MRVIVISAALTSAAPNTRTLNSAALTVSVIGDAIVNVPNVCPAKKRIVPYVVEATRSSRVMFIAGAVPECAKLPVVGIVMVLFTG